MSRRFTHIAAAAALLAAAPAFAASTASASAGPIQVTLFDLNPLDGITPSISFDGSIYAYGSYVAASAYDTYASQYLSNGIFGTSGFDPVSVTVAVPGTTSATATVGGTGTAAGATLSSSGTALGTNAPGGFSYQYSSFSASAYAPYYYYQTFTLSSGTAAVITLASQLSAAVTNSYDPGTSYGYENASASASVSISGTGASGSGSQSASDSRAIGVGSAFVYDAGCVYGYCYAGAAATDSATIGVSFVNVSGGDLNGQLFISTSVNGYSYANAVPEPGTYAMMLAGLAAVGFLVRRRGR